MVEQVYTVPKISNAGNVIRHPVGGGKQGHKAAHDSEAPMAMSVAERFVCWYVEPDGIICDPMCGSGTTIHAAIEHGRRGIGVDIRQSQIDLTIRRMRTVTMPIPGMHTQ
jgi:DNA modification methylase